MRLMLEIAEGGGTSQPVQLSEVARRTGISRGILEQLAVALKSHSLLSGICGRKGGYVLTRSPSEIPVGKVIAAIVGPILVSTCVEEEAICMRAEFCACRQFWSLLQLRIDATLNEFTIGDLMNDHAKASIAGHVAAARAYVDARTGGQTSREGGAIPACAQVDSFPTPTDEADDDASKQNVMGSR